MIVRWVTLTSASISPENSEEKTGKSRVFETPQKCYYSRDIIRAISPQSPNYERKIWARECNRKEEIANKNFKKKTFCTTAMLNATKPKLKYELSEVECSVIVLGKQSSLHKGTTIETLRNCDIQLLLLQQLKSLTKFVYTRKILQLRRRKYT